MLWKTELGRVTLFGIEDGWMLREPTDFMPDSDPAVWAAHPEFLEGGKLRVSFGCFLVHGPSGIVMVDTGVGPSPDSAEVVTGRMPRLLDAIGVRPDEVDHVLHTHLHFDHIGGDAHPSGGAFFPNARLYVHRAELDYWLNLQGPPGDRIRSYFGPFVDEGRVESVEGDREIVQGIAMSETFGHTPGHMSVEIVSGSTRAVIAGDVTHHPIQASHPEWNIFADLDRTAAVASRRALYDRLGSGETMLAAGHFPRPGFGTVWIDEGVRFFVPAAVEMMLA